MAVAETAAQEAVTHSSLRRVGTGRSSASVPSVGFHEIEQGHFATPGSCTEPVHACLRGVPSPLRSIASTPVEQASPIGTPAHAFRSPKMMLVQRSSDLRRSRSAFVDPGTRTNASLHTIKTKSEDELDENEARKAQRPTKEQLTTLNNVFALIERDLARDTLNLQEEIRFPYKGRICLGGPIHIAALHERGWQVMSDLLELRANVTQEFSYTSYQSTPGTGQPIHLAAAYANISVMQTLLEARADINAKAKYNRENHYEPIHEAAFFHQDDAVDFLVSCQANVNSKNRDGLTPLHVAAKQGAVSVVKTLLRHGADAQLRDCSQQTPLMLAVDGDSFPVGKLHLLTRTSMGDVLEVARRCPSAANVLMKDKSIGGGVNASVHGVWSGGLVDVSMEAWVTLMDLAPGAAEDVLEAVTTVPRVQDPSHHPLPRRARLKPGSILCYYGPYDAWGFDFEDCSGRTYPEWHDHMTPGRRSRGILPGGWTSPQNRSPPSITRLTTNAMSQFFDMSDDDEGEDLVEVRLKLVKVSNLLSSQVLLALADTKHEHIFAKLATQGMLEYLWSHLVCHPYCLLLCYRCLLLLVLVVWVARPPQTELYRRVCWSLITAISTCETIYELWEMYGYTCILRQPWSYFDKWKNWCDLSFIIFTQMLCWTTLDSFELNKNSFLLAIVALHRWWQVLYTLRAFTMFGRRILPILKSFNSMGAMLVITLFIFMGFFHAYLALAEEDGMLFSSSDESSQTPGRGPLWVLLAAFRTLLVGDGEGINDLVAMGDAGSTGNLVTWIFLVASVFSFCICILNLYIAVQGEAYDIAQEHSKGIFMQERTSICLQCIMRPHWPARCTIGHPVISVVCIGGVATAAWFALLSISELHPVVPSTFLVCIMVLMDSILLIRPWNRRPTSAAGLHAGAAASVNDNYLWICHRADWEECAQFPTDAADLAQVQGRLGNLRMESARQATRLKASIQDLARKMQNEAATTRHREMASLDQLQMALIGSMENMQKRNSCLEESIQRIEVEAKGQQLAKLSSRVDNLERTFSERLDRMDQTLAHRLDAIAKHLGVPVSGPSTPEPARELSRAVSAPVTASVRPSLKPLTKLPGAVVGVPPAAGPSPEEVTSDVEIM